MKFITSLFFLLITALGVSAQTAPTGVWNTGNENTKVEITEADGVYVGKVISSDKEGAEIGRTLLKDLKQDGEAWQGKLFSQKKANGLTLPLPPKERC